MFDPPIVDEKSLEASRLIALNDLSLMAVIKVLIKRPEYSKLENPFRSEASVKDLSQVLAFLNKANPIQEGLVYRKKQLVI